MKYLCILYTVYHHHQYYAFVHKRINTSQQFPFHFGYPITFHTHMRVCIWLKTLHTPITKDSLPQRRITPKARNLFPHVEGVELVGHQGTNDMFTMPPIIITHSTQHTSNPYSMKTKNLRATAPNPKRLGQMNSFEPRVSLYSPHLVC